jgi:hypothetical protein
MDVHFFMKERIAFIRQFYGGAAHAFLDRKLKIESGQEPYVPTYSEDAEPPFLSEWLVADQSLQILGYSCISMLSSTLKIYFGTWAKELQMPVEVSLKNTTFKKEGFFNGYKAYFKSGFGIDFDNSSTNQDLLKEITLARNRMQHLESIHSPIQSYESDDLKKIQSPFFVSEVERSILSKHDENDTLLLYAPTIDINKDKMDRAFAEVEIFSDWLQLEIKKWKTSFFSPGQQ